MASKRWYDFLERMGRWFNLPARLVSPVWSLQWGWGTREKPSLRNIRSSFGRRNTVSLYYNGLFYFRFMLPFYVGVMVRWSGDPAVQHQFLQTHVGWKLNGEFALTCRIQCDDSAYESNKGPQFNNTGQALGFEDGTK